jgi:LysM repeat protein
VTLRIRYRTSTYEVQSGDSGYRIARRTGVPFTLMQQANPRRDWDAMLSPGEMVNLPSPDEVVPLDPVPNKRIIVDLETQTLWAYENGQLVFNWLISSGMDRAPTSPGIFQILDHQDTAVGSSVELCGDNSCGSWTMYWFMGIYEVSPGLVNGFHGRVVLPGGTIMGNGNVGTQYTYGCIMSIDGDAEQLYRWAEVGTMVEIVSRDYPPRSDLARMSLGQTSEAAITSPTSNS